MRKIIPISIAGSLLAATGGAFGAYVTTAKAVAVTVDGVPSTVTTHTETVGQVLAERGIAVDAEDEVTPAVTEKVIPDSAIEVKFSRDVTLNLGKEQRVVPTTALTVGELMDELQYREESKISAARSTPIGRQGLTIDVVPAREVNISVGGKPATAVVTSGNVVEDALRDGGVKYGKDDEIKPAKDTSLDDLGVREITVDIVKYKESEKKTEINFRTVERSSRAVATGQRSVKTPGQKGVKVETIREKLVNGKSVEKKSIGSKTAREPVDEVVLIGSGTVRPTDPEPRTDDDRDKKDNDTSSPDRDSRPDATPDTNTDQSPASKNTCKASYYWQGQMTANGEQFNPSAMTAAHKTLKFGTRVKVTNPSNGKTVTVRINDRGPYISGRCLDLSKAAMAAIGGTSAGVITVKWETV